MRTVLGMLVLAIGFAGTVGRTEAADRYELGKRLQRCEREWQLATPEARARAVAPMQSAVGSFFSLQFGRAARGLDEAWFAVRSTDSPSNEERLAIAHRILLAPRLVDAANTTLKIAGSPCYDVAETLDSQGEFELRRGNGTTVARQAFRWLDLPQGIDLNLDGIGPGDFKLVLTGSVGSLPMELNWVMVSRVDRLADRMAAVERAKSSWPGDASETVRATVDGLLGLLKSLASEQVQETDFPANRLLEHCETLVASQGRSVSTLRELASGQDAWITLARDGSQSPIRLRAPPPAEPNPQSDEKPWPVLFLFHGAGGSENMFFDAYGAGRAVDLGTERRWLVIATRQTLFNNIDCKEILDILHDYFPIDRKRVFCIGHSMGAGQVVRQVTRHPQLMSAAAALGGGGRVGQPESVRHVRWFVGAGEADFGRGGAVNLVRSLEKSGANATYREYKQVEHMMIVQAALDDVFRFFDDES
ncbi:MAG: hypothetical protein FJ295_02330 [Planctomycetes bacterium]|nr:hypothetical protein [Planctomycetota bacterium]